MEDISQEPCPKGGKHELQYLRYLYSIVCKKCGKGWSLPYPQGKGKNYNSSTDLNIGDEE